MSERSDTIARAIQGAVPLIERFFPGFDDTNRTRQAPGIPNHAAWTLGHLALYARRAADLIAGHDDARALPASDFITADGRGGDAHRFDSESVCYGSEPTDDPALYPAWDRCVAIHASAQARLVEVVRAADDASLDRSIAWGSTPITGEQLAVRMLFHLGTHTGQLVDLRRGLGIGRVLG